MGTGFLLFIYFGALACVALVLAVLFGATTAIYLKTMPIGRRLCLTAWAAFFPFGCVFYAAIWFAAYATLDDKLLHHDPMIGDGWYTNIGHGYAIPL